MSACFPCDRVRAAASGYYNEIQQSSELGLIVLMELINCFGIEFFTWRPSLTGENLAALERLRGKISRCWSEEERNYDVRWGLIESLPDAMRLRLILGHLFKLLEQTPVNATYSAINDEIEQASTLGALERIAHDQMAAVAQEDRLHFVDALLSKAWYIALIQGRNFADERDIRMRNREPTVDEEMSEVPRTNPLSYRLVSNLLKAAKDCCQEMKYADEDVRLIRERAIVYLTIIPIDDADPQVVEPLRQFLIGIIGQLN